jgi:hypothetical protein
LWFYHVYGLRLGSNQPLPGLVAAPAGEPVDVSVEFPEQQDPEPKSTWSFKPCPYTVEGVAVWVEPLMDSDYIRVMFNSSHILGHTEFAISPEGDRVWATWPETRFEDGVTLFLGQVLACVLRLRGVLCLHASVVKIRNHAIAILGHKGMGKSTTAAALAQQGYPILSDDIAALSEHDDQILVQPGDSRLRLWPATLQFLESAKVISSPVLSISDKQYLQLAPDDDPSAWRFQSKPLPLVAIYVLDHRQSNLTTPTITPILPAQGLMTLVEHISASLLPLEQTRRAQEFKRLGHLASTLPLRQINRPNDLKALPQLCEIIVADSSVYA